MTDLRRALTNAIRLLQREASLRRLSIEGGAKEFEEDAKTLQELVDQPIETLMRSLPERREPDPVDLEPLV